MKTRSLIVLVLAMAVLSTSAWAQSFQPDDGEPGQGKIFLVPGPNTITQSTDTATITALNSVACPADDDNFSRRFDLDGDHGIVMQFDVTSVTFGIETSTGANATINLYTIPSAAPLTLANLSPIGTSGAVPLPNTTLSSFTINVAGTVADPTTTDLYVEIFVPDFNQAFNFFPGSNPNGQIAPTYLRSAGCGAVEPTPTGDIGFPNMHLVMLVDGIEAAIPVTLQSVTVE